jgi:hypothetical protein
LRLHSISSFRNVPLVDELLLSLFLTCTHPTTPLFSWTSFPGSGELNQCFIGCNITLIEEGGKVAILQRN